MIGTPGSVQQMFADLGLGFALVGAGEEKKAA